MSSGNIAGRKKKKKEKVRPARTLVDVLFGESGYVNRWQDASIFCDPGSIFWEYMIDLVPRYRYFIHPQSELLPKLTSSEKPKKWLKSKEGS